MRAPDSCSSRLDAVADPGRSQRQLRRGRPCRCRRATRRRRPRGGSGAGSGRSATRRWRPWGCRAAGRPRRAGGRRCGPRRCSTPKVSRATRAARMLELSPLLTAAKACGPLDAGLAQVVAVEADARDRAGRRSRCESLRKRGRVLVDDGDRVARRRRGVWASADPTRPQPMMTTCTVGTLHGRAGRSRAPYASGHTSGGDVSVGAAYVVPTCPERFGKRLLVGRALSQRAARRDPAAQAHRPAGVRLRRAVVERVRHPGDPAHPRARRGRALLVRARGSPRWSCSSSSSSSRPTGRTCTPTPAAAATTRSSTHQPRAAGRRLRGVARCSSTTS